MAHELLPSVKALCRRALAHDCGEMINPAGVRLREAPFLPERVKAGMDALRAPQNNQDQAGRTA